MAKKTTAKAKTKKAARPASLPGDRDLRDYLDRMIRVNHAGEFGAKQIYAGQIAVLGNTAIGDTLRHMAEQEDEHLKYFEKEMQKRRIRPTVMYPLWQALGFALGAGTALLGKEAAMACTVAVEEVIDAHYEEQVRTLPANENELKKMILKFQAEELEHRDIGLEHDAEKTPGYKFLYNAIATGCKAAIWLSKRA